MKLKKQILSFVLMLTVFSAFAQTSTQVDDYRAEKLRQEIGLDYSMPDYSTKKIDAKVIGSRLATILELLQSRSMGSLNQKISFIQCEQIEGLNFVVVEKFTISKIEKVGDVITIKAKTKLADNIANISKAEIVFVFKNGLSDSSCINGLFADLGRYIK